MTTVNPATCVTLLSVRTCVYYVLSGRLVNFDFDNDCTLDFIPPSGEKKHTAVHCRPLMVLLFPGWVHVMK